jgi:cysteine desulfurase
MTTSYLDYNSTAPLHDLAKKEMLKAMDIIGNPSSSHKLGLKARMVVDDARYSFAQLFDIRQEQVVFTSGGTESNNMILKSVKGKILTSPLEHPSVINTVENFDLLKLNDDFSINLNDLEEKLATGDYELVSVAYVNSETGIIQNIKEIAKICKKHKVLIHTDATQAFGKIDVNFNDLEVNLMTLSPHKIGLAKGVGIIITDGKASLDTLITGGGQERGRRSGTENVQALATLSVVETVLADKKDEHIQDLRRYLEVFAKEMNPKIIIVGENANRVNNTSYIITPGIDSQTQVINADMADVCISAGSACSSGDVKASKTIKALGFSDELASCGVRISIGTKTTKEDIDKFLNAYKNLIKRKK